MVETKRHGDAFDYYYSLGEGRSCQQVAIKLSVSRTSVQKWKKAFNWDERVIQRDLEINKRVEEKTNNAIANTKADYRALIKERLAEDVALDGYSVALIGKAKELIESGEMKLVSVRDFVEVAKVHQGSTAKKIDLMKADLLLMGEADSRVEGNVTLIDVLRAGRKEKEGAE